MAIESAPSRARNEAQSRSINCPLPSIMKIPALRLLIASTKCARKVLLPSISGNIEFALTGLFTTASPAPRIGVSKSLCFFGQFGTIVAVAVAASNASIPRNHGIQTLRLISSELEIWAVIAAAIPVACSRRKVLLRSWSETVSAAMTKSIVVKTAGPPPTSSKKGPRRTRRIGIIEENQQTRKFQSSSKNRPRRASVKTTERPYRSARRLYGMASTAERELDVIRMENKGEERIVIGNRDGLYYLGICPITSPCPSGRQAPLGRRVICICWHRGRYSHHRHADGGI